HDQSVCTPSKQGLGEDQARFDGYDDGSCFDLLLPTCRCTRFAPEIELPKTTVYWLLSSDYFLPLINGQKPIIQRQCQKRQRRCCRLSVLTLKTAIGLLRGLELPYQQRVPFLPGLDI